MTPIFSPDGTKIALPAKDANGDEMYELYTVGVDGGEATKITGAKKFDRQIYWQSGSNRFPRFAATLSRAPRGPRIHKTFQRLEAAPAPSRQRIVQQGERGTAGRRRALSDRAGAPAARPS